MTSFWRISEYAFPPQVLATRCCPLHVDYLFTILKVRLKPAQGFSINTKATRESLQKNLVIHRVKSCRIIVSTHFFPHVLSNNFVWHVHVHSMFFLSSKKSLNVNLININLYDINNERFRLWIVGLNMSFPTLSISFNMQVIILNWNQW